MAPDHDEIEITLIGPGFGECVLIHVGAGRWIVVDCCSSAGVNLPMEYLQSIGVSFDSIDLVVATHWHDDHIRGIAQLLESCKNAAFCMSAALTGSEFRSIVEAYRRGPPLQGSGVEELRRCLDMLGGAKTRPAIRALGTRQLPVSISGTPWPTEIWSLSPSDKQFDVAIAALGKLLPVSGHTKGRLPSVGENQCSVVIDVRIGAESLLLGADLEISADASRGWLAIVDCKVRPRASRSTLFKVPHHGSENGHEQRVWDEMLEKDPLCMLAPYNRGAKRPSDQDVKRILGFSSDSYITASPFSRSMPIARSASTAKLIKSLGTIPKSIVAANGRITARKKPLDSKPKWHVELAGAACRLSDL